MSRSIFEPTRSKPRGWVQRDDTWTYHGEHVNVHVHPYVHETELFVTCYELRMEKVPLNTVDYVFARQKALEACKQVARLYVTDIENATDYF